MQCSTEWCRRAASIHRTKFGVPLCMKCYQRRNRKLIGNSDKRDDEMFVYFVRSGDGYIKIGRAKNVSRRVSDLQVAHAQRLELMRVIAAPADYEFELHARFADLRVRDDGEWFAPGKRLLEFIANPSMPIVEVVEPATDQMLLDL